MKRLALLLLPLALTACGEDVRAKLDHCKEAIRAELATLLEETKRQAAESVKAIEAAPEPTEVDKLSNEKIKTVADLFARMAGSLIETQLAALEPTAAGLAKCEELLADARRR